MAILRSDDGSFFDLPDEILSGFQGADDAATTLRSVDGAQYHVPASQLEEYQLESSHVDEMLAAARQVTTAKTPPPSLQLVEEGELDRTAIPQESEDGSPRAYCGYWRNFWRNYWRNCWRNCYYYYP